MKSIKPSRANAIDAAFIIVLIFLLLTAYMSTNSKKIEMLNIKPQSATVVLDVLPEYITSIKGNEEGKELMLAQSDICIGKIANVKKVFDEKLYLNDSGVPESRTDNEKYTYRITVNTAVKKNVNGYYIDNALFAAAGKKLLVNLDGTDDYFYVEIDAVNIK